MLTEIRQPQKKQLDLVGLSRVPLLNRLRTIKNTIINPAPKYTMGELVDQNWFMWMNRNLSSIWSPKFKYGDYQWEKNNGVFTMEEAGGVTKVTILSDWASDTLESQQIATIAGNLKPHYTIHLGDTYYTGNIKEIDENFSRQYTNVWPYGSMGSFALLGNHEMYSGGGAFIKDLLPHLGILGPDGNPSSVQEASYFCLQNDYWRLISLDTGYNSNKGFFGIAANTALKLEPEHMVWLREKAFSDLGSRGIILLSHHQCVSAFEKEFNAYVFDIGPLLRGRTVLWFWGHEHRLAIYGKNQIPGGITCFPRCIGHGGMPIETKESVVKSDNPAAPENRNLVLFDVRIRPGIGSKGIPLGYNGFINLSFQGAQLQIDYLDNSPQSPGPIVTEKWTVDPAAGSVVKGSIVNNIQKGGQPLTHLQDINIAVM